MKIKLSKLRELHREMGLQEDLDLEDIAVYNFLSTFIPMQKNWDTLVYHEYVVLSEHDTNLLSYYL